MLLELSTTLIYASVAVMIAAFCLYEQPLVSIVSGIFWISTAYSISSIKIYNAPSADPTPITVLQGPELIYLFGGVGVIMLLHAVYRLVYHQIEEEAEMVEDF